MNTSPHLTRFNPLIEYTEEYGRLPRQSGADRSSEEMRAGNILRVARNYRQEGRLTDEQLSLLNERVPGWASASVRPASRGMRGVRTFSAQVHKVKRFVIRHNRMPSAGAACKHEAALGRFLRNHRQALQGRGTCTWTAQKENLLDTHVPGWDRGIRNTMAAAAKATMPLQQYVLAI